IEPSSGAGDASWLGQPPFQKSAARSARRRAPRSKAWTRRREIQVDWSIALPRLERVRHHPRIEAVRNCSYQTSALRLLRIRIGPKHFDEAALLAEQGQGARHFP